MRFIPLAFSCALIVGSAAAFAEPGIFGRNGMNVVRAYQLQGFAFEKGGPRDAQQPEPEQERRRNREAGAADSSGYGAQEESGVAQDHGRRHGKLSPEERRALRRQIDEAGQDLYTRKH